MGITNIDLSPLFNITHLGDYFLSYCKGIINIDLSPLSNIKHIGSNFLSKCTGITNINLQSLSNVTHIKNNFLSDTRITNIDLTPLSNVTYIGSFFLYGCCIKHIDLSPLPNVTHIGDYFLSECKRLATIIVNEENDYLINNIEKNILNVEIKTQITGKFKNYEEDKDKIKTNKDFAKELIDYLKIEHEKENSHELLQETLKKIKEEYEIKMNEEDLNKCINNECLFTMEELINIQKKKMIMLDEYNGKYYCFDVVALRNFIFQKQKQKLNNKYINPYTEREFKKEDIDKILKVDIKKIKYFCEY
jgi:hypothetical protein